MIEAYFNFINNDIPTELTSALIVWFIYWVLIAFTSETNYYGHTTGFTGATSIYEAIEYDATLFGKIILYPIWAILFIFQWVVPLIFIVIFSPIIITVLAISTVIVMIFSLMFK